MTAMYSGTRTWIFPPVMAVIWGALLMAGCQETLAPQGAERTIAARPTKAPAAVEGSAAARFEDHASGISFQLPPGMQVETESFDASGPAGQMRHRLVLIQDRVERLSVEVWDNPTSLPVGAWFEEHLSFVRDGLEQTSWATVSSHRVRGMVIRRPRSPQAFGQRMAVFAANGRVVRLVCQNEDHAATLAAHQQVLASIRIGGAR